MSFYPRRRQFNQQFNMPRFNMSRYNMPRWSPLSSSFGMHPLDVFSEFMPSMLNQIIDPYLSQLMNRQLRWINVPSTRALRQPRAVSKKAVMGRRVPVTVGKPSEKSAMTTLPRSLSGVKQMPQKYRILIGCTGVSPSSCRTQIKRVQDQCHLIVSGGERDRLFKRSFTLPLQVEAKKLSKFVTPTGQLCVEFPFQEMPRCLDIDLVPKICKGAEGKCAMVRVPIPEFVDPAKVQLFLKDRNELIVRFENRLTRGDSVSRVYYYNCVTLPEYVNASQIQAKSDKHRLIITAPVRGEAKEIKGGAALRPITIQRKLRQRKAKAVEPVAAAKKPISGVEKKKKPSVTPTEKKSLLPVTPTEEKKEVKPSGGEAVQKPISPKPSGTKLSEQGKIRRRPSRPRQRPPRNRKPRRR